MRSSAATLEEAKMREASLHLVGYVRASPDGHDHADQLGAVRAAGSQADAQPRLQDSDGGADPRRVPSQHL